MQSNYYISTTNSTSNATNIQSCLSIPPFVNSDGLWAKFHSHGWWLNSSLPLLELQLVMFCLIMTVLHLLLKRFGASKISSQIITGLIFGCSWGKFDKSKGNLFRINSEEILGLLSYFGYTLFLFITAVKMDVRVTLKTGKKAWMIGMPSVLVPIIFGIFTSTFLLKDLTSAEKRRLPLMVSLQSIISFPVIASLLNELKIVSTELGRLGLSSALVADLFSQCALAISNQLRIHTKSSSLGYYVIGALCVQIFLTSFLFRPAVFWIVKRTPDGKPVSRGSTQAVFLVVMLSAVSSTCMGLPAIIGPYLLGLLIPDGGPVEFSLVEKLESFVSEFFMPVFVVTCASKVDLSLLFIALRAEFTRVNIILAFVTYVAQFLCALLGSLYCQLSFKDSLVLSLIFSSKGVVELSICSIFTEYNIISSGTMAWLALFLLIISTFVPIGVNWLNEQSRKQGSNQNRNMMHLNPNSEFRVLACIHKSENIYGFIHLLNISCPTLENPMAVYALHLIELVGRTAPMFISHRTEGMAIGEKPYSENVILSFDHFEKENSGSVYTECFTTVSPNKFMKTDICKLAMDKLTALIILPFHRTWTNDGLIDQEDNTIRTLNCSIIEKAPCSVAILADKGHLGSIASMTSVDRTKCKYSVCVIFMGGSDDREAISFAKRIANDSRVDLTVMKLGSVEDENGSNKWERMLDCEVIKDFKMTCLGDGKVKYLEEVSEEGPQTALRVREMVNEFDLMIVGRRKGLESISPQTSGLSEWNEFQELGVLGDLIASLDNNTRTSVLVIQQKK